VYKQQQQEAQEQDAEKPFLDPPFSRIKTQGDTAPKAFKLPINIVLTRHSCAVLLSRAAACPYGPRDFEFSRALDLHGRVEGHLEVVVRVLCENALKRLLEQGGVERVPHHHVTAVSERDVYKSVY
jgi:hypothetical protein